MEIGKLSARFGLSGIIFQIVFGTYAGPTRVCKRLISAVSSAGDYADIDRELERYRELANAGFTDLALKIFDDPMENLNTICERVIPNIAQ